MPRPPFPSAWSRLPMTRSNLNLANTLPVGQSFLWHRLPLPSSTDGELHADEEYSRAVNDPPRVICLRQTDSSIWYTTIYPGTTESATGPVPNKDTLRWLENYFQLDTHPSLEALYSEWRTLDPMLFGKTEPGPRATGVRLLRQDPWECLLAFITSSNNHIPRITSLLHRFSQKYAPTLLSLDSPTGQDINYHLFPPAHTLPLDIESDLRELGFGYRAGFIQHTIQTLRSRFGEEDRGVEDGLKSWRAMDIGALRNELLQFKGVGRKVADCVLLMSFDKSQVIPIDTHVLAIASRHPSFPTRLRNKPMSLPIYDEVQRFLADRWGPLGGWCQAVMFAADLNWGKDVKAQALPPSSKTTGEEVVKRKRVENQNRTKPAVQRHEHKRSRSSARLELKRSASSGSVMADAVSGLRLKDELDLKKD